VEGKREAGLLMEAAGAGKRLPRAVSILKSQGWANDANPKPDSQCAIGLHRLSNPQRDNFNLPSSAIQIARRDILQYCFYLRQARDDPGTVYLLMVADKEAVVHT
jgi:hypothetical protein